MFKDNLVELRKYHDLSQEELADMIGVSRQTLSKYETGESLTEQACYNDFIQGRSLDQIIKQDKGNDWLII